MDLSRSWFKNVGRHFTGFERNEVSPSEKGLQNLLGENNCFINVVIQSLWHIEIFRERFCSPEFKNKHLHTENCVFCSLEVIFTQYRFSEMTPIPPTALRETLAVLFRSESKFQLRELDDASEAFEAVLGCLHDQMVEKTSMFEKCNGEHCLSHQVFGIHTFEKLKCESCGSETSPAASSLFTIYAYAASLRDAYEQKPKFSFDKLLHYSSNDLRPCPNEKCKQICFIEHYLISLPPVFTVSIVWDSAEPVLAEIKTSLEMLSKEIDLSYVFSLPNKPPCCTYRLKGMICYYGKHYVAIFNNFDTSEWYMFDDSNVKLIGTDWNQVHQRCLRGRLQPSVIFYEHVEFNHWKPDFRFQKLCVSTVPDDVDMEDLKSPEHSFIQIPSAHPDDRVFIVQQNTWFYRVQERLIRFSGDCFMRVEPTVDGEGIVKQTFRYQDVLSIKQNGSSIEISFYSGTAKQCFECKQADQFVEYMLNKCKQVVGKEPALIH